jgi:UDP-2,3-diacylglucosamine pyrophosphatase LpxH
MIVKQAHRNSHIIECKGKEAKFAFMSDLHWDNPHCDRVLLKKHLDRCLAENRGVILNGDTFCLMQGKYDPRRSKKNIRPEHNKANYLDAVIQDAVEWFAPYRDILLLIGYGNHETAIIKNVETDPLQRFVDLMNMTYKTNIQTGGYGGWITIRQRPYMGSKRNATTKVYYYHGSGGGGPVTKGTIQHQRQMADIEGADIITMGHVHELYTMLWSKKYLNTMNRPDHRHVHHFRTGTYKDEYEDGYMGWHVERGAPPKPLGCVVADFHVDLATKKTEFHKDNSIITPTIWT